MVKLRERKFQLKTSRDKELRERLEEEGKHIAFDDIDRSRYPKLPVRFVLIGAVLIGFIYLIMKMLVK